MTQTLVGQQLFHLLMMALFGCGLLFAADCKKALAQYGRWRYWRRNMADFFFCLVWGLLFWLYLLWLNGGLLRNYILLGLVGGCTLYITLISRRVHPLCRWLARLFLLLWRGLCLPWRALRRLLGQPCKWLWKKFLAHRQEIAPSTENMIENQNNFSSLR